jgi:hypothetical protein
MAETQIGKGTPVLDGVWRVRRVGGLLPPMFCVRKYIKDGRGATRVGPLVAVPFLVDGNALRYRGLLEGFVDLLDVIADDSCSGRATFGGRTFGRFEMRPIR